MAFFKDPRGGGGGGGDFYHCHGLQGRFHGGLSCSRRGRHRSDCRRSNFDHQETSGMQPAPAHASLEQPINMRLNATLDRSGQGIDALSSMPRCVR